MQWTFFYNIDHGAWVRFDGVPLGKGYRRFRAVCRPVSTMPTYARSAGRSSIGVGGRVKAEAGLGPGNVGVHHVHEGVGLQGTRTFNAISVVTGAEPGLVTRTRTTPRTVR